MFDIEAIITSEIIFADPYQSKTDKIPTLFYDLVVYISWCIDYPIYPIITLFNESNFKKE